MRRICTISVGEVLPRVLDLRAHWVQGIVVRVGR